MPINEVKGKLVIIGGGVDRAGDCTILKAFVRLGGGSRACICIMTVATDEPLESGGDYKPAFENLGAGDVKVIDVSR